MTLLTDSTTERHENPHLVESRRQSQPDFGVPQLSASELQRLAKEIYRLMCNELRIDRERG